MMRVKSRTIAGLLASAGVVAAVLATSAPAASATDAPQGGFEGGPEFDFVGSNVSFTAADQTLTCPQFDLAGQLMSGVGVIDQFTWSGCASSLGIVVEVGPLGERGLSPSGSATGTVWPTEVNNMLVFIDIGGSCSFHAAGSLDSTLDTSAQVLTPTTSDLIVSDDPVGALCPLLGIVKGDPVDMGGTWTNVPPPGSDPITVPTTS